MAYALEIYALAKRFGDVTALDGLSFGVVEGEVFGLIGPDGAGKTTTMRIIAGLLTPGGGQVKALGLAIPGQEEALHGQMGYMPQQYSLYGDLSVHENLSFFAGMYGVKKADFKPRMARLLDMARLTDFAKRPAAKLSGGMYKKLALCCALVHRPRLLLLDEPTNGVDPISRRELWAFLYELVREGVTVLVSTPYMDEAERCNHVGLVIDGRLVGQGRPAELRDSFHQTVFELEVSVPMEARAAVGRLSGSGRVYPVGKKLHVLTARGPGFESEIRAALASSGVAVVRCEVVAPSFEDIFLEASAEAAAQAAAGGTSP